MRSRLLARGVVLVAAAALLSGCVATLRRELAAHAPLALVGGTVYPSPTEPALEDAVVLVAGGRIEAVGRRGEVRIPKNARVLDCAGATVTAGFWNSHVHFTEPKWLDAGARPAAWLEKHLQRMFTRHGFVHVVDAGSPLENTLVLRRRIELGEVAGPAILTGGAPFAPEEGGYTPSRIPRVETETPLEARLRARERLEAAVDFITLFPEAMKPLDEPEKIRLGRVKALVAEAHRAGKPAVAHPSTKAGVELSARGGVDVVLNTLPEDGAWSPELVAELKRGNVALVPTLKKHEHEMFGREKVSPAVAEDYVARGVSQLAAYAKAGGTVLFGTDVGDMDEDEPGREYELMRRAGLDFRHLLASLTTAPAERFGLKDRTGRVAAGLDADLVVLDGDPTVFLGAMDRVRYALLAGKVVYQAPAVKR